MKKEPKGSISSIGAVERKGDLLVVVGMEDGRKRELQLRGTLDQAERGHAAAAPK